MSGCCVDPPPKALVSFYGYGDIVADWYSKPDPLYCRHPAVSEEESGRLVKGPVISEPYEGRGKDQCYLYCRQNGLWPLEVSGVDPKEDPEFFTPYCPAHSATSDYPPDVPYSQSVQMAETLSSLAVEHRLITIDGGGHGFDGDMDSSKVEEAFASVLTFLNQHLGD
jgi:acetyl esterase/lipase